MPTADLTALRADCDRAEEKFRDAYTAYVTGDMGPGDAERRARLDEARKARDAATIALTRAKLRGRQESAR